MPTTAKVIPIHSESLSDRTKGFSLVAGGPLYQFLQRVGLVKPPLDRAGWRMLIITLLAWAPLLVLTALSGRLTSGVKIPFLYDFEAHARLLVALPLLVGAEVIVSRRTRTMLLQFVDRQIIAPDVLPKFEACVASALGLRNSVVIELGLLAVILSAEGSGGRAYWPSPSTPGTLP